MAKFKRGSMEWNFFSDFFKFCNSYSGVNCHSDDNVYFDFVKNTVNLSAKYPLFSNLFLAVLKREKQEKIPKSFHEEFYHFVSKFYDVVDTDEYWKAFCDEMVRIGETYPMTTSILFAFSGLQNDKRKKMAS